MFTVVWVGWINEGSHDKLWGVLKSSQSDGVYYNFWGRRGKKPQFKQVCDAMHYHKERKGYKEVSEDKLLEIFPDFFMETEMALVFDSMAGKVR